MNITPSNFHADPLGWLGNQIGHMFLAALGAVLLSYGWFWAFGALPYRWAIWAAVSAVYLVIEMRQRGRLWDTVEDIVFVCVWGPLLYIAPFKEVAAGSLDLDFAGLDALAPYLGLVLAHLAVGGGIRLRQARHQNRVARFFDRVTSGETFEACTDFFIFYQVTFLFPSILFYYDALASPGKNFLPDVWGAWACQYPAVMWATIMWGGAAITVIGLTRPQRPAIVMLGAAMQLSHFAALALSALLTGGQEFMAVYQGLHFVPIHAIILVGAYRHGRG